MNFDSIRMNDLPLEALTGIEQASAARRRDRQNCFSPPEIISIYSY
jgi:hypothetical protein